MRTFKEAQNIKDKETETKEPKKKKKKAGAKEETPSQPPKEHAVDISLDPKNFLQVC